jgi:hypothetical protein
VFRFVLNSLDSFIKFCRFNLLKKGKKEKEKEIIIYNFRSKLNFSIVCMLCLCPKCFDCFQEKERKKKTLTLF